MLPISQSSIEQNLFQPPRADQMYAPDRQSQHPKLHGESYNVHKIILPTYGIMVETRNRPGIWALGPD